MNEETDKITGKFFKSLLKECQEVLEKNGKKKKGTDFVHLTVFDRLRYLCHKTISLQWDRQQKSSEKYN